MSTYSRPQTGWSLVTPATSPAPIYLDEAKLHLRIDGDEDNDYIQLLIDASVSWVEQHGLLLNTQTWDMFLDCFPYCEPITLWKHPVQFVDFIKYVDADGTTQTLDESAYQVSLNSEFPRIMPAYGTSWPSTRSQMEAVTVRFTGGFNSSPQAIPATVVPAMQLLIGHLYANREAVVIMQGIVSLELPFGLEALLDSAIRSMRWVY